MKVALDGIGAWFCENKEGKGDQTGSVSPECMAAGCEASQSPVSSDYIR